MMEWTELQKFVVFANVIEGLENGETFLNANFTDVEFTRLGEIAYELRKYNTVYMMQEALQGVAKDLLTSILAESE